MGWLSWLFPSEADRLNAAKAALQNKSWMEAREALLGIDSDEAKALIQQAEKGLVLLNLDHARSWAEAGDGERIELHLELAEMYHRGGLEEQFKQTRRSLRTIRQQQREAAEAEKRAQDAKLMDHNPLGLGDRSPLLDPSGADDPDYEERQARLALHLENYPQSLQGALPGLGPSFAQAILDLDDGRPDLALPVLRSLPNDQPLVRWERARIAHAMGDPTEAARELRAFITLAGQHFTIGTTHTGVLLAQVIAEAGQPAESLAVLKEVRETEGDVGGFLFAQLLDVADEHAEAEAVLRTLIARSPRTDAFYLLLAQIRLKGDHREQAKQALEAAMGQVCDSKGCGHKPPNRAVLGQLATLYLEDDGQSNRGLELAQQASAVQSQEQPSWDDLYLAALVARAHAAAEGPQLVQMLYDSTPEEHPHFHRLRRYLSR